MEVDTRKATAVLAYLAVEGSADRDRLAALFWTESPPDRARATLRRTLSALRAGFGPDLLVTDRSGVRLSPAIWLDIEEFGRLLAETGEHGHDSSDVCDQCLSRLQEASDLYRGDFLGTFSVRDAPEFDDWSRTVAESFRLRAGAVLRRLAHARAATGDYPAAIDAAHRWVGLDELHEPAHRLVMLLKAWAGDRAGAIQAYRNCLAVLDRELGVGPLEETSELFEAILDEDLPPAPAVRKPIRARGPSDPTQEPRPTMVGRRRETTLLEELSSSQKPAGSTTLVTGESWMGKSRLLEHAAEHARRAGWAVATANAFRAEEDLPYGVVIQLLDGLVANLDEANAPPPWARDELARLLPRLDARPSASDPGRLGEIRLRDAFLALVESVTADRPLLMMVDDAHWVDVASAGMIGHLGRAGASLPLALLLSTSAPDSLPQPLRGIAGDPDLHVQLAPLVTGDLDSPRGFVDLEAIIAATGGIPRLVAEALEAGKVDDASSSVLAYLESRLQRLSDLGRQVLTAAAVLDGMCDATLLRETSGRTEEEIVEAVEELMANGLLTEMDDGRLGYTLDVLERVTYESTSLVRRRLLHRRAARALEMRPRAQVDPRLAAAVASHLQDAGEDEAAEWYRLAGDLARRVYAHNEAMATYQKAIALGHPDAGAIHLALGELETAIGEYSSAMRELHTAASRSEGATLAQIEHRIGDVERILGRFDLAEESFVRAEAEHPHPTELLADWALLRQRVGDHQGARDLAYRSLSCAESTPDKARALNVLGVVSTDVTEASSHIDRALETSPEPGPARMAALNNKAHLLAGAGDLESAVALVTEAVDIASRTGYRHHYAALLNHLADLHHRAGRADEAAAALTEAVKLFADVDAGAWRPEVWLLRQW